MKPTFVPAYEGYRKLKLAYDMNTPVYISGATGYGKTRLVESFTADMNTLWLVATEEWELDAIYNAKPEDKLCVVIDDIQYIRSEEKRELIIDIIRRQNIWTVLIGRIKPSSWMMKLIADGYLLVVPEKDLHLGIDEIKKICELEAVDADNDIIRKIADGCMGNGYMIMTAIKGLKMKGCLDDELCQQIKEVFTEHLQNNVIPQWDAYLQEFMMAISIVNEFTLDMAVMITGDDRASVALEQAEKNGNFLIKEGDTYILRPYMRLALHRCALNILGQQKVIQYANNAGLYYEMKDNVPMALKMYELSKNTGGIRTLLIRNGRRHMGDGYFYELRKYYFALTDEDVEYSPILMSALCMLNSVMLNYDKSEYWYKKLKDYASSTKGGHKREASELLLYLDIALPHKGTTEIIDAIKRAAGLMLTGGVELPEFSVTSNLPSVMNGGKDFCSWSKKDQFLADTIGKMVEKILGSFGRGLIHAALSESFYEKAGRDAEVVNHALFAQMDVDGGGKLEMTFAAIGVQIRLSVVTGNIRNAYTLLDKMEALAKKEDKKAILFNIEAIRCRLALYSEDRSVVENWLVNAPDENAEFWSLERYRYITKVWVYLNEGRNETAINLLEKLRYYAELAQRTYIRLETGLLLAIAYERTNQDYCQLLLDTLDEIYEYRFVRIISELGVSVLPLLKHVKKYYQDEKKEKIAWLSSVIKETTAVAERYPAFLICNKVKPSDFGEVAVSIIRMQAEGYSLKDIAARLGMSERTAKYHAAENYRKLGAKGKTDAVQIARSMNLI